MGSLQRQMQMRAAWAVQAQIQEMKSIRLLSTPLDVTIRFNLFGNVQYTVIKQRQ